MVRLELQCGWADSMGGSSGCGPCYSAQICQRFGDELIGGPATSIAHADPVALEWMQAEGCALVRGRGERAESSSPTMSAMMAVLKLFSQQEDTYVQVMRAIRQAQEIQQKGKNRARKFHTKSRLLEQTQKDRNDWEDIAEYRRQQWVKATHEKDHKQDQSSQLSQEKDALQEHLVQVNHERDTALRVSENRCQAWELHHVHLAERLCHHCMRMWRTRSLSQLVTRMERRSSTLTWMTSLECSE